MKVKINWTDISHDDEHPLWSRKYALYAYYHPQKNKLLYIGKCLSTTILNRWQARDKLLGFWSELENEGIHSHRITVGEIIIKENYYYTNLLLKDIENLLIFCLQPWGNIQCINSMSLSHKLEVHCKGDWYHNVNRFKNN